MRLRTRFSLSHQGTSIKIDPIPAPAPASASFCLDRPISPVRPVQKRTSSSHPIAIKHLPDSSSLFSGPLLSPVLRRFRIRTPPRHYHSRTQSVPVYISDAPSISGTGYHSHTQSLPTPIPSIVITRSISPPPSSSPINSPQDGSTQLRDRDHHHRSVRGPGAGRLRHLLHPEPRQPVREADGEGPGRGRVRNELESERYLHYNIYNGEIQIDRGPNRQPEPDPSPPLQRRNFLFNTPSSRKRKLRPPAASSHDADSGGDTDGENKENSRRTTSGKLRWEDDRDTWF